MKKVNIAQIGSFDVENYGDLLFVDIFNFKIREFLDVENIVLFAPKHCIMPFTKDVIVYSVMELEEKHLENNFDAIIIGGGDLIHMQKIFTMMPNISEDTVEYEAFLMWSLPCFIATKYNIPLIWNCPGVPKEFLQNEFKFIETLMRTVNYISVRDNPSKENLLKYGFDRNITVSPDTVLLISQKIEKKNLEHILNNLSLGFTSDENYVVFQANAAFTNEDKKICAECLKKIKEEFNLKIVVQPIGYALGDQQTLIDVISYFPNEFILNSKKLSPIEILSVISSAKCYIGSSLHGCITANSYGVPSVVCNYTNFNKIEGYFEFIKKDKCLVNKPSQIYDAFRYAIKDTFLIEKELFDKINLHFSNMVNVIKGGNEPHKIVSFGKEICEYAYKTRNDEELIYWKDNHIFNLENLIKTKKEHIKNLEFIIDEKTNYTIHLINEKEELSKELNILRGKIAKIPKISKKLFKL